MFYNISDNPKALLNLIWLNYGMFFGLRGRQDHLNMLWGDIQLKKTSAGKEFLEFNGTMYIYNIICIFDTSLDKRNRFYNLCSFITEFHP